MNMTRDRVQSLAWTLIVLISFALLLGLTFRVNAVKSQVRLADRKILSLKLEKASLENEFQTRANQQQLAALNEVDLGLKAPSASQYIGGEVQLASLSRPVTPVAPIGAPAPTVMLASAQVDGPKKASAPKAMQRPVDGIIPAVFTRTSARSLVPASATRLLAQHGENVAPGGTDRLERTLGFASERGAAGKRAATPLGPRKRTIIPAAGPPAASADFLAVATGSDHARGAAPAGKSKLAPGASARKAVNVAAAFDADWVRQMSSSGGKHHQ
jgi:hypothetical protein